MEQVSGKFFDWLMTRRETIKAVCFDIDGTLATGPKPMPGARELVASLREARFPFILLTNDGNHSIEEKRVQVAAAGIEVEPEEIVSCGLAIAFIVERDHLAGERFFIMGELGSPNFAELAGLAITRDRRQIDTCRGVIVGETNYDWESTFNAVINFFIRRPECPMLVPNPDTYWPHPKGKGICVGAGGKARFIESVLREYGRELRLTYLGKPHRVLYDYALERLRRRPELSGLLAPEQILMVGDSLKSDVLGAHRAGWRSALVLTGITTWEHLDIEKDIQPDFTVESFL